MKNPGLRLAANRSSPAPDRSLAGSNADVSTLMRTHMFGPEPPGPTQPDLLAALVGTAGRLAAEAAGTLSNVTGDELVTAVVAGGMQELDRATAALTTTQRPLRIALMGRTMAGKSTLFETLTGGDGSRMGKGAQRTTRKACERALLALPGVTLVDTPGVGAKDGHEDRQRAFEEMLECDLVLWVAANDSTQQETADALAAIADLGKPLIVTLNCRQGIGSPVMRERFLRDPDRPFRDMQGHLNRLRRILAPLAVRPAAVTAIHAQAAFHALSREDHELQPASRIDALLDAIQAEMDLIPQRQALTMLDSIRGPVTDAARDLRSVSQHLAGESERTAQAAAEYQARLTRVLHEAHADGELQVDSLLDRHRDWHVRVDLDSDVGQELKIHLDGAAGDVEGLMEQIDEQLREAVEDEQQLFIDDWTLPPLRGPVEAPHFTDPTAHGNRAAKIIARAAFGAATVAAGVLTGGWALLGVGAGSLLVDRLVMDPAVRRGGWIDRWFPGRREKLRKLREQLATENADGLQRIQATALQALADRTQAYRSAVATNHRTQLDRAAAMAAMTTRCADAAAHLLVTTAALDAEAARTLLGLAGRSRCAQRVTECARHPGRAMAVGFTAGAATEEALFPTATAEPIYPFDADAPRGGPRRVLHVVAAAYPPPYRATRADAELTVSVGADDGPNRRAVVADLASRVSDLTVAVTLPETAHH